MIREYRLLGLGLAKQDPSAGRAQEPLTAEDSGRGLTLSQTTHLEAPTRPPPRPALRYDVSLTTP